MTHRQPALKDQATLLRSVLSSRGHELRQGEALELVSRLNGYPSWNVASRSGAARAAKGEPGEAPGTLQYTVWVAVHYHRHGQDSYYFPHQPSKEEVIAHVDAVSFWEPELGESVEILGTETFEIDVPEEMRKQLSRTIASPLISVYEVNMLDLVEYEDPEAVPEWRWVAQQAAFQHVGNGVEGGVWEHMVHADKLRHLVDTAPEVLRSEIHRALSHGATWVMFHQG